jgi:hypothetical protein
MTGVVESKTYGYSWDSGTGEINAWWSHRGSKEEVEETIANLCKDIQGLEYIPQQEIDETCSIIKEEFFRDFEDEDRGAKHRENMHARINQMVEEDSDFDADFKKPTKEVEDVAHDIINELFVILKNELRLASISSDADGSIRVQWFDKNSSFRVVITNMETYYHWRDGEKSKCVLKPDVSEVAAELKNFYSA